MKVISTKIVNGKKMFLIEEPTKLFAQNGFSSNPYYVPIQGSASSENTRTKLTPKTKLTPQELDKIKNSQTSAKAIALKEAADKATRLAKSNVAYKKRIDTGIQSSQDMADETGAIGDKISLQNLPYVGKYIPDFLDATGMIGNMASGLGRIPLNLEKGNYGQAALDVAIPLGVGTLAGVSANTTGEFINNIVNPLAGTGQIIDNIGNKYLPNAYKYNPLVFKPNPEAYYRVLGKEGLNDALESGVIRANPKNIHPFSGEPIYDRPYFSKGVPFDRDWKSPFKTKNGKQAIGSIYPDETMVEVLGHDRFHKTGDLVTSPIGTLNSFDKDVNFYKRDWLRRYKEVPKAETNFKSEINWGKWNKEIPENTQLLEEYNTIEQTSKANGTWMKNPDGSAFQGTPEQFVQQNSQNFKKAFPEGSENVFRGTGENIAELRPNRSIFTANQELASGYAPFNKKSIFLNSESGEGGVHSFYRKNSKNSLELDANNTSWTSVDLSNKRLTKDYFERNIKSQEDQITKQKEYLSKMKQNPNGSWEAPDGTTYSNDLYKNTVAERELYLKDLKERYKNIDNLISNPKELEEMRKVLGNTSTTDDIATYVEKRNLDYVKLKNIEDSGVGDVTIVNHKPGNYLKSAIGNNGMFDMTNPNIYKSIVGALATGTLGKKAMEKQEFGGTIKVLDTKIEGNKKMYLIED